MMPSTLLRKNRKQVTFSYYAPSDRVPANVELLGEFNQWNQGWNMKKDRNENNDRWVKFVLKVSASDLITNLNSYDPNNESEDYIVQYKFKADGQWVLDDVDPDSKPRMADPIGNINHWVPVNANVMTKQGSKASLASKESDHSKNSDNSGVSKRLKTIKRKTMDFFQNPVNINETNAEENRVNKQKNRMSMLGSLGTLGRSK